MACASSPTAMTPAARRVIARTISACTVFVSWYSSTSTWSKRPGEPFADAGVGGGARPVEQEVVEVQELLGALALDVLAEDGGEGGGVGRAPRERVGEHVAQRPLGVGHPRVDGEERVLAREPGVGRRGVLAAHQAHQVGGVGLVEHAERRGPGRGRHRGPAAAGAPWRGRSRPTPAGSTPDRRADRRAASISAAARRVNVSSRIRSGATPRARSAATRAARVLVFPVPAPATTSSGPSPCSTTRRCAGLSSTSATAVGVGIPAA